MLLVYYCNYCIIQVLTDLHFSVDYYLIKQNVSTCSSYETSVVNSRNLTISGVQPGNIYYLEITPYFESLGNSCSSTFFIQGLKKIMPWMHFFKNTFCIDTVSNTDKAKGLCMAKTCTSTIAVWPNQCQLFSLIVEIIFSLLNLALTSFSELSSVTIRWVAPLDTPLCVHSYTITVRNSCNSSQVMVYNTTDNRSSLSITDLTSDGEYSVTVAGRDEAGRLRQKSEELRISLKGSYYNVSNNRIIIIPCHSQFHMLYYLDMLYNVIVCYWIGR